MNKSDTGAGRWNSLFGKFLLLVTLSSVGCKKIEVPTPENWSPQIVVKETFVTEDRTVEDSYLGTRLFTYHMYPTAQPILVSRLDGEPLWVVVLEKPATSSEANRDAVETKVSISKVSENEYRLTIDR